MEDLNRSEVVVAYHDARDVVAARQVIEVGQITEPALEELHMLTEMLKFAYSEQQTWGLVILKILWEVAPLPYKEVYKVNSLIEYATKVLGAATDQVEYHVHIVERVLLPIQHSPVTFSNPQTGETITPQVLVETPGLVGKLKAVSPHFRDAMSHGNVDRAKELIGAVVTQPVRTVNGLLRTKVSKFVPIIVQVNAAQTETGDVEYRISSTMSEDQFASFRAALGKLTEWRRS